MVTKTLIKIAAAVAVTGSAVAAPAAVQDVRTLEGAREVSIPFARFGKVRNFRPDGRDAVYLQDRGRNWYYARLTHPCFDLPFAHAIGIDTRGGSSVDQFTTLIVGNERCRIGSLVRSGPPPKKVKKPRRQA